MTKISMQNEIDRRHQLHIICPTLISLNEINHKIFHEASRSGNSLASR